MVKITNGTLKESKVKDRFRAQATETFENLPQLLGFDETVILRGVKVDHSRNLITFYFAGEGLEAYWEKMPWVEALEGQESVQIELPIHD